MFYNNNTFLRAEARSRRRKASPSKINILFKHPKKHDTQNSYTFYDADMDVLQYSKTFHENAENFKFKVLRVLCTQKTVLSSIEHQKHNLSCIRNCYVECDVRICMFEGAERSKKKMFEYSEEEEITAEP